MCQINEHRCCTMVYYIYNKYIVDKTYRFLHYPVTVEILHEKRVIVNR